MLENSNLSLRRFDLNFWYGDSFGSPVGRALGIGYVQELVARLTKTPIQTVCCNRSLLPLSSVLLTIMRLHSTTRPPTRRWTVTQLRSPWTDVLSMSTPPTKWSSSTVSFFSCFRTIPSNTDGLYLVLTALNLTTLAATGPLPYDHIPEKRSFITHEVAAFGTNVQFQSKPIPSSGFFA